MLDSPGWSTSELGVDDQNVRQEAKDDIRKVIRRLQRSAKLSHCGVCRQQW